MGTGTKRTRWRPAVVGAHLLLAACSSDSADSGGIADAGDAGGTVSDASEATDANLPARPPAACKPVGLEHEALPPPDSCEQEGSLGCWDNTPAKCVAVDGEKLVWELAEDCSGDRPACMAGVCREAVIGVAAGDRFSCALRSTGRVQCWGENAEGSLGLGDVEDRGDEPAEMGDALSAVDLGKGRKAVQIAAGRAHACALLDDGDIRCWGNLERGAGDPILIGDEPGETGDSLPALTLQEPAVEMSALKGSLCVLTGGGDVVCWRAEDSLSGPGIRVALGDSAVHVATGGRHTCALLDDGALVCWGNNLHGQLGLGDTLDRDAPERVSGELVTVDLGFGRRATQMAAGVAHTCAALDDGNSSCWGLDGSAEKSPLFSAVGARVELGLAEDGTRGDETAEMGPGLALLQLTGCAKQFAVGWWETCALSESGRIQCWGGIGKAARLGGPDSERLPGAPIDLGFGRRATAIAVGARHACAVLETGQIKCWGSNLAGALGQGDRRDRPADSDDLGENLAEIDLGNG